MNIPYIIAIDFDDTLCLDGYPDASKGKLIKSTVEKMKEKEEELTLEGLKVDWILWTCRTGEDLENAKSFLFRHDIHIKYFNESHPVYKGKFGNDDCRKIFADEYWDDKAVKI